MKKSKTREHWKNAVLYISSSLEQVQDANNDGEAKEAERIYEDMYRWLTETYRIGIKKRKPNIFNR